MFTKQRQTKQFFLFTEKSDRDNTVVSWVVDLLDLDKLLTA